VKSIGAETVRGGDVQSVYEKIKTAQPDGGQTTTKNVTKKRPFAGPLGVERGGGGGGGAAATKL
jgi:hypothetical protein